LRSDYISMQTLDWLVVAPRHDDLAAVDAEIAAIAAHHNVMPEPPLIGYVTDMDISNVVSRYRCDVFCWSTHASKDAIQLSDGYILDADTSAQFVRASGASLCIFNVCLGERFAQRVAYLCDCDVVYTPQEIDDRQAALYMSQLAAAIARHKIYYEAYQAAGSHGGQYKYIHAKESVTRGRIDNSATIAKLEAQNSLLKTSVTMNGWAALFVAVTAMLVTLWLGSVLLDVRAQVGEIRAELRYLERTIDDRGMR